MGGRREGMGKQERRRGRGGNGRGGGGGKNRMGALEEEWKEAKR